MSVRWVLRWGVVAIRLRSFVTWQLLSPNGKKIAQLSVIMLPLGLPKKKKALRIPAALAYTYYSCTPDIQQILPTLIIQLHKHFTGTVQNNHHSERRLCCCTSFVSCTYYAATDSFFPFFIIKWLFLREDERLPRKMVTVECQQKPERVCAQCF